MYNDLTVAAALRGCPLDVPLVLFATGSDSVAGQITTKEYQ
jgi:hypothetical protein